MKPSFDLVLLTGMSGAGRSTAAHALEDLGFMVIDNLPPQLIQATVDLLRTNTDVSKVAVVADARGGSLFSDISEAITTVKLSIPGLKIVFLEASDLALVRRFESSRRPHPLQAKDGLLEAIHAERELLNGIREVSDLIIDTTERNVHDLRRIVEINFEEEPANLKVTLVSFGFKYGIPMDADLIADMRFLPNPFWTPELREKTGLDSEVSDYVTSQPEAKEFLQKYSELLKLALPGYIREGKRFVTIGIGCTGGKHRSVAMAENLSARLVMEGLEVQVVHRDRGRE